MIRKYKPTSPGRRDGTVLYKKYSKVKKNIKKKLTTSLLGSVGRSNGRVSVQHRRRGAKKRYRVVDFKRDKRNIEGKVKSIDYDPCRTCDVALISYFDGDWRYILAPEKLKIGDIVVSGDDVEIKVGNATLIKNIPVGIPIHNIELYPNSGGKFIRSAGSQAVITAKEGKYVNVKMQSGEVRKILSNCYASIGMLGNFESNLIKLGKAGRSYHLGIRPTTRGKARSVYDHPMGGSYSRRIGRHPVDQWGNLSKGKKTRKRKHTNKYIVKDRRSK